MVKKRKSRSMKARRVRALAKTTRRGKGRISKRPAYKKAMKRKKRRK